MFRKHTLKSGVSEILILTFINVNLKPILSLLFFYPRFLSYYGIYPFNISQTCSEHSSAENDVPDPFIFRA